MKAYSLDLREKILTAYLNKEGSLQHLAERFKVSARFVWGLVNHFRHTGRYAPKPPGGGNPPRIHTSQYEIIKALVKQYPDATLKELCVHCKETTNIMPSTSGLHRILDKLRLTRKKRPIVRQNRILQTSRLNEKLIKKK